MSEQELSPGMQKIVGQIQKLLNLAAKAGTPEEAAAATAKAQELLAKYNLDSAIIEKTQGKDAKREELKVDGGFFEWQRSLWKSVAELNFCIYWAQMYNAEAWRYVDRYTGAKSMKKTEDNERKKVSVLKTRHALVGRIVNTRLTVGMAQYLEQTIERLLDERLKENEVDKQSNWAHSFRKGVAEAVIEKVEDRRQQQLSEARQRARAAAARAGETTTSTALTLDVYIDEETDANNDFIHGEGWSAEQARQEREAAERRRKRAEEYTKWAEANPEEARKRAEEAQKEARRYRGGGPGSRGGQGSDRTDYSAYSAGRKAGKSVSIDPQTEHRSAKTERLSHG